MEYKCLFKTVRCLVALAHLAFLARCVVALSEFEDGPPVYYSLKVGPDTLVLIRPLYLALVIHIFGALANTVTAVDRVAEYFVEHVIVSRHCNTYNWLFGAIYLVLGFTGLSFICAIHRFETIVLINIAALTLAQNGYFQDLYLRRDMSFEPEISPVHFSCITFAGLVAVLMFRGLEVLPHRGGDVRLMGLALLCAGWAFLIQVYFVRTSKKSAIRKSIGNRHVRALERIADGGTLDDNEDEEDGDEDFKANRRAELSDLMDLVILENWHALRYDAFINTAFLTFCATVSHIIIRL